MVEINNQQGVPRYAGVVGGTDNGRQKTRNHGYDVIVGGELFTDYSDHPRKHTSASNSNQQAPDATSFFPVGGMPQAAWPEDFSPKSQDAVACSRLRAWRFTYD